MKTATRVALAGLLCAVVLATGLRAPTASAAAELVVVAGANGRTGRLVVEQLLAAQKWTVRGLVHQGSKSELAPRPGLELRAVDVRDAHTLVAALAGATYLISTIGASGLSSPPGNGPNEVDFQGVRNLAHAAQAAHVRQFVLVSSTGTGHADSHPSASMRPFLKAKYAGEQALRASGVPYTIVRPGGLTDAAASGSIVLAQGDTVTGRIARADVAAVCVAARGAPAALAKTVEVVSGASTPPGGWHERFAALQPDAPLRAAAR